MGRTRKVLQVHIVVTATEHRQWKTAARTTSLTLSQWLRFAAREQLRNPTVPPVPVGGLGGGA